MKYDLNFKLDCVLKYKEGIRDFVPHGIDRNGFLTHVKTWVKIFDDFGIEGLKHSSTNKDWTVDQRFELVTKVIAGDSITNVAKNAYINQGMLYQWVKRYREKGMDGLKSLRKGRPSREGFSINIMPRIPARFLKLIY